MVTYRDGPLRHPIRIVPRVRTLCCRLQRGDTERLLLRRCTLTLRSCACPVQFGNQRWYVAAFIQKLEFNGAISQGLFSERKVTLLHSCSSIAALRCLVSRWCKLNEGPLAEVVVPCILGYPVQAVHCYGGRLRLKALMLRSYQMQLILHCIVSGDNVAVVLSFTPMLLFVGAVNLQCSRHMEFPGHMRGWSKINVISPDLALLTMWQGYLR